MRTRVAIIVSVLILCAAWAIMVISRAESYSLSKDVREAETVLALVSRAEASCHKQFGHYYEVRLVDENSCQNMIVALKMAEELGYSLRGGLTATGYEILVIPKSKMKLVTLYFDESGAVRIGTTTALANGKSQLLKDP